jgi:hypothetical protein
VAVDPHAVDFLHVVGEELGDVLVGGPVHRHAEVVAVDFLELGLQVLAVEPVLAEPVEVGELLVGQLVELAVRPGGERLADEVVDVEGRQGHVGAVAGHPVGQIDGQLKPGVGADQVGIVDVGIVEITLGLHLGLDGLDHLAFAEQLVVHFDAGDLFEGLGEGLGFVLMGRDGFRQHVDFHALERFGRLDEKLHLRHLFVAGQGRGLKFLVDPLLRFGHAGRARPGVG